ncbi:MAG: DUF885 domain-containing protein [Lachnospiraceae bacterium]|nr:DUF885 domain-containing protein [Lachnospiraceae bacterium]
MNSRFHKLKILCLLPCLLLSGCSKDNAKTTPTPPVSATFAKFADELFREYAASDSLSLHYTVLHPEQLQIAPPPVSLGEFGRDALLSSSASAKETLDQLHTYERNTLDASGQLLYSLLDYALTNSILPEGTEMYDSPLGPTTGLQTQLPILLAEYRFSSRSDVEDYFLLLSDLPRYFAGICTFEQERAAAGTGSCAEVLSRILLQCNAFVENPGDNFLIVSFKDRLASLPDLTATDIATLCMENQKLVFTKVIPAYEQLIETLSSLLDTSAPAKGLCALPNGTAYYEYLVHSQTGSHRSVEELESMLDSALQENMLTMLTLYESQELREELKQYQEKGLSVKSDGCTPTPSAPEHNSGAAQTAMSTASHSAVLQHLQQQIQRDFPTPSEASFRVELIHPSLEDFISPALYLVPPLDAYKENVIYINKAKCSTESLFSTLAHEGYPGHLYQNTYFAATNPHPLRMLLNFTGYDEGWGTYAELYSYEYANCSAQLKQFLIAEQVAGLCLYSLSDIKIHYHGADLNTIVSFLGKYGFSAETAQEIFYTQLAEPVIYLPYSVGYLELCGLREQYLTLQGADASLLPFHTFLLETGPAPFSVLETLLNQNFR